MNKKIDLINLKIDSLKWLRSHILNSDEEIVEKQELTSSLKDLIDGYSSSIMIEVDDGSKFKKHANIIECGKLQISYNTRQVFRDDEEISLTPKEFDILYFLAKNRGIVFTKEQIYRAVWESDYLLDDSNIMAFIRKLRKKIEPNPDDPIYILTIWGIGYKFNDEI